MSVDKIINLLVTLTLIQMMVTIGLGVTVAQVVSVARNPRLLAGAALANYVAVPLIAVGLLFAFRAPGLAAAGFMMTAVCPGAPYGPPFTGMAKGNVPIAVGLMVLLAASSAILAPILLHVLLPVTSGDARLDIDVGKMVETLLVTQLVPLVVGMAVRAWRPALADALAGPAKRVSLVLNLAAFGFILAVQGHLLLGISPAGFGGMLLLALLSVAVGWLLGPHEDGGRVALAFSTGVRNVGVSLVIATASFPGTPAVTAALAYALFQTIVLALLAAAWGKGAGRLAPAPRSAS
ncbi:MAG: bile acid:sodium symporter [Alsobacter sp.]